MKLFTGTEGLTKALLAVLVLSPFALAHAQTLGINYYTISSSDPDAGTLTQTTITNEVQNSLGSIDNLPVLNTSTYNSGCVGGCVSSGDHLPGYGTSTSLLSDGEITYWDTANPYVTETLTSSITLPVNIPANFFPPNGTGNKWRWRSRRLSGRRAIRYLGCADHGIRQLYHRLRRYGVCLC